MLPSLVAREIKDGLEHFLRSAFPVTTPGFLDAQGHSFIDRFLAMPGNLYKGPWLEVKLPFRPQAEGEALPFRQLSLPFPPYRHQQLAFARLCGPAPKSTIVATGTGSGKTECFMYPLLDYCLGERRQGIKAIIIYPMNALATDQARRFAREVSKLQPKLSVGLFTGDDGSQNRSMTPEQVITHRDTLRENPPDILLTNYKMLDYLLLRPKDQRLWRYNTPGLLRFVVVDELHTFDGAQGTDLACLIRRLRDRLKLGSELACVGTSATIGDQSAVQALREYAGQVFATPFDDEAIVLEDRLTVDEYLARFDNDQPLSQWPEPWARELLPGTLEQGVYLRQLARLWLGEELALDAEDPRQRQQACVQLGRLLTRHEAFRALLKRASQLCDVQKLAEEIRQSRRLPAGEAGEQQALALIDSLCALISAAREWADEAAGKTRPFLQVRVQLWLRELRRMVATVGRTPLLVHSDDVQNPLDPLHLPLLHCRECHATAWGAVRPNGEQLIQAELQRFYSAWFGQHPDACLLYPLSADEQPRGTGTVRQLCSGCLRLLPERETGCPECSRPLLKVWLPALIKQRTVNGEPRPVVEPDCPCCGGEGALSIVGYRAASLASVAIGELYGSAYNDHYKLIAFSDSVQDAAHRAGFFGARTYSQVVRQAIARVVRSQGEGMALSRLVDEVPAWWRRQLGDDAAFAGTFIAPNMEWLEGYRQLQDKGALAAGSDLAEQVAKRLRWETLCEFGLRSRIGRTLERTATATLQPEPTGLRDCAGELTRRLREELGSLRDSLDEAQVLQFLLGLLTRLRQHGAFHDPLLEGYVRERGNTFPFNRILFLPGYGPRNRPPAALTLEHVSGFFETIRSRAAGWYLGWFNKCLAQGQPLATAEYEQAYRLLIEVLERRGLLQRMNCGQDSAWMLQPERWLVTARVAELACGSCGHRQIVAGDQAADWQGLPCLRHGCLGQYGFRSMPRGEQSYRAWPRRLVPSEHTGLLDGEQRHAIEQSFITGEQPWDVNLLSATPTLEMGINIGDLSSVLLCSVPPAQANYLQRIGRAGRQDGNALALTIANGHSHDLYFYGEPLEMLAGQVATPGVFLQAMAVLERQLIAYCFDRWVATGVDDSAIPGQLRAVLDSIEAQKRDGFPHNLLGFVEAQAESLLQDFLALFPELDDDGRAHLQCFIGGSQQEGSLGWRITQRLGERVASRKSLLQRAEVLKKRIAALEQQPADEQRDLDLRGSRDERSALLALIASLNKRQTLNFFTDEGLLPNYAFPEEGVTLDSVILRRREQREAPSEGDEPRGKYELLNLSFQRPAQAALGELAPEASFYAAAHQLQIEQVDLKLSKPEEWRLCNQCHHSENLAESGDQHSVCPRCGSPQWADIGQKRTLLKLRQVYARADSRFDRIGDDSDQREPAFFKRQLLVEVEPGACKAAWKLDNEQLPFGFEFLHSASFREINFGTEGIDADAFEVAGRRESRKGFRICKHCGMVKRHKLRRGQFAHALDCPLARAGAQEKDSDWFDSLYLYRELKSEAIRILLPVADVAQSEKARRSFVAALNMGLKRYFKGDVHHLEITEMAEPAGAGLARQYLVIYDRVPGGTGYLKELMSEPGKLLEMLRQAHHALANCGCVEDEQRDGCYRCILAYRDSRNMAAISRQVAESLLGQILQSADQLVEVEGLAQIEVSHLLESPLEERLLAALGQRFELLKKTVNGKPGYWLNADGRMWELEPQVNFGPAEGVVLSTRADFVLRPARDSERSVDRELVIYTDGFGPHCANITDDTRKRQALLMAGKRVLVLGWDDLPETGKAPPIAASDVLLAHRRPASLAIYDKLAERSGWPHSGALNSLLGEGSFRWLERWLRDPDATTGLLRQAALANLLGWLEPKTLQPPLREQCQAELQELLPAPLRQEGRFVQGGLLEVLGTALASLRVGCRLAPEAMASLERLTGEGEVHLQLDDRLAEQTGTFQQQWRAFWQAFNLLQFAPRFSVSTHTGVLQHGYDSALQDWPQRGPLPVTEPAEGDAWQALVGLSLLDELTLGQLAQAALPLPEVGEDLLVGEQTVGTAELCWKEAQVALFMEAAKELPLVPGWTLLSVQSADWMPALLALFGKE